MYHSIQTLIKNVFLLNFAYELLMSFLSVDVNCFPRGPLLSDVPIVDAELELKVS